MAKVEIGFRAVVEDINFAVLVRAHRAGIDVEVRIEFLEGDLEAAIFKKRAKGCGGQTFAKRTHHAAGYKNVFHFVIK